MASEKSSRASVGPRSKRPPPKTFVTRRASSSVVIAAGSPQVARGPTGGPNFSESWLFHAATIDGVRAPREEGASGREIAQQRDPARDAAKRALLLERRQARAQHLGVGVAWLGQAVPDGRHHAEAA